MNRYIKWFLIIFAAAVLGFLLLGVLGQSLIREVTYDVDIDAEDAAFFGIAVGEKAPLWRLMDLKGEEVALPEFLGIPLVVTFRRNWLRAAPTFSNPHPVRIPPDRRRSCFSSACR